MNGLHRTTCVVCQNPRQMSGVVCHHRMNVLHRMIFFQSSHRSFFFLLRKSVLLRMICVVFQNPRRMSDVVCHHRMNGLRRMIFFPSLRRMTCVAFRCQILSRHPLCLPLRFLVSFLHCCRTPYGLLSCGQSRLSCCFPFCNSSASRHFKVNILPTHAGYFSLNI